jgi:hypothetical protein
MMMLRAVTDGLKDVYIIVDALDECPKLDGERAKLLDIIHQIYSWEMKPVHILVTSRRELDIEESLAQNLTGLGSFEMISLQGPQVEQDIQKYLRHRLQDRQFSKWDENLKRDIELRLASQANGMWVNESVFQRDLLTA